MAFLAGQAMRAFDVEELVVLRDHPIGILMLPPAHDHFSSCPALAKVLFA